LGLSRGRRSPLGWQCGPGWIRMANLAMDSTRIHRWSSGPAGIRTQDQGIHVILPFPAGVDYLFTRGVVAGRVRDARACHQGHWSPQVVSAPSGGVPPTWLRIACSTRLRLW